MGDTGCFHLDLLWATELVVTRAQEDMPAPADSPGASEGVVHRLQDTVREIAGRLAGTDCSHIRIVTRRRQAWSSESDLRLARGSTRWQALVILQTTPAESDMPALFVRDPRVGVEWVETPGSPYGRPLAVPIATGLIVVMPGWLEWSIRPLAPGSTCDVLLLDLDDAQLRAPSSAESSRAGERLTPAT